MAEASYVRKPTMKTAYNIEGLRVPSRDIEAKVGRAEREWIDTTIMPVDVNVGMTDRVTREFEWNATEMGDWDIHIGTINKDGEEVPLTSTKPMIDGGVSFDIDTTGMESLTYMAVATLR
ncbi:hypothetical protein LCGC14_2415600, partial [marine sediment metagenome]